MTSIRSACTYDCPDACGLLVRSSCAGLKIEGDGEHPITCGFTCARIRRHAARLVDPERLTSPMLREGGSWRPIGWDRALDRAAEALGQALADPRSVVFLSSGGSLGLKRELLGHFFHSLGPITSLEGGVCGEAGEQAQLLDFGAAACHDFTDLANSAAVVLWGKDPVRTGPHIIPFLKRARQRGVPITLVEVLPTPSARLAQRVVRVAPGGDGFLALAVLRWLLQRDLLPAPAVARCDNFEQLRGLLLGRQALSLDALAERAGVSLDDIAHLGQLYGQHRPLATWVGWGLTRRVSGGRNLRCIDALGVLSGNVGLPGGGVNFTSWRRRGLDLSALCGPHPAGRRLRAPFLGQDLRALSDPPARFVYVALANPVTQLADSTGTARALRAADFTVVADAFMTDTACCADLVLPVSLMLEDDEVVGSYQHHHVAFSRQAVMPPAGARHDLWIASQLRRRLGLPADPLLEDPQRALEDMVRPWFDGPPLAWRRNPCQPEVPFAERFATASGRARLIHELPGACPRVEGFPLVLITPPSRRWQTSQLAMREQTEPVTCHLNPDAPGVAKLGDSALACLRSPNGCGLRVRLRFDTAQRTDVCVVRRGGAWQLGRGVNALVQARATDLGLCTAFHDQRVRLEPWHEAGSGCRVREDEAP